MTQHEASRTLVKSPPELWAECSDATSLARHLQDSFGEIRITRLEPETAVAWEGERASGTVRLEPAGWGTKVVLTVTAVAEPDAAPATEPVGEPIPTTTDPPSATATVAPATEEIDSPPTAEAEPPSTTATGEQPMTTIALPATTGTDAADTAPLPRRRRFARLLAFLRGPEVPGQAPQAHAEARLGPRAEAQEDSEADEEPDAVQREPEATKPAPADVEPDPTEPAPADAESEPTEPAPTDVEREATESPPPDVEPQVANGTAPAPALADTKEALAAALDSLGQAHHRPYSRG